MKNLPVRLYICPGCQYTNPYRWVLTQHLRNVHGVTKREAAAIAASNEFLANPITYHRKDDDTEIEIDDE